MAAWPLAGFFEDVGLWTTLGSSFGKVRGPPSRILLPMLPLEYQGFHALTLDALLDEGAAYTLAFSGMCLWAGDSHGF